MNYNRLDANSMRQEALRRTRQMHMNNLNKAYVQAPSNFENKTPPQESMPMPERVLDSKQESEQKESLNSNEKESSKKKTGVLQGLISGIFQDGKLDNDKIIIIALIIILAKEGADLKLLLALGYILM